MGQSARADEFDYVIVGAGSAGCVLARRLTESGKYTVCVLEAGPADRSPYIHIPAGYVKNVFSNTLTWGFYSAPVPGAANRKVSLPQGRTLGGSSSINGMIYNRGQRGDYDGWAQRGNRGWGYDDVLPYFKRSERRLGGVSEEGYHGFEGPLTVSDPIVDNPLVGVFSEAAREIGVPEIPDYNGKAQDGVGPFHFTIDLSGRVARRMSTARAFLRPALKTGRVSVRTRSYAARILFENRRAIGIRYLVGGPHGRPAEVRARREVILSAGAINTPRLLQISGVGDPDHLHTLGVATVQSLPGVGQNLTDHYQVRVTGRVKNIGTLNERGRGLPLFWEIAKWMCGKSSILSMGPVPIRVFLRSDPALDTPDLQLAFIPGSYTEGVIGLLDPFPGITSGGYIQRPESRGWVRAVSTDLSVQPEIQPNYLGTEGDRKRTIAVVRLARRLMQSKAFSQYLLREEFPGDRIQTDDEILDFAGRCGGTAFHHTCTARMGPAEDKGAVVSDRLQVHGLRALRVVDASVMPAITSGNTNAPTIMIAEKASDMILEDATREH